MIDFELQKAHSGVTCKDLVRIFALKYGIPLSATTMRSKLRHFGYRHRPFRASQQYVGTEANVKSREIYAKRMIELLEKDKRVLI